MARHTATAPVVEFEGSWDGQVIASSVHAGHGLRAEIAAEMVLDEEARLREEDPHTDVIGRGVPARVVTDRSRFEVDLNRPRHEAVYRSPDDCWGLDVWADPPLSEALTNGSLDEYDEFYGALGERLDVVAARGPFVLLDVHSYNHRRGGADADPEAPEDNPEVNVGTGSLDDQRFRPLVEDFMRTLGEQEVAGAPLDVRENVRFRGRALAQWVHDRYPGVGCCLALEFKKTFMDEWTAEVDNDRVEQMSQALAATLPVLDGRIRALR